jgi:hypothetical protein
VDGHTNFGAVTGKRLVNAIIDQLEHHMMQTTAIIGIAYIC